MLKISGEALKGKLEHGFDPEAVKQTVDRVVEALNSNVQIALVVGAGNLWRGASAIGMDRVTADYMGMLGTVMNALCLKDAFLKRGVAVHVHACSDLRPFAERFNRDEALLQLERGELGQGKYDALQREIVETEQELKRLQEEAATTSVSLEKLAAVGDKFEKAGDSITNAGKKFAVLIFFNPRRLIPIIMMMAPPQAESSERSISLT